MCTFSCEYTPTIYRKTKKIYKCSECGKIINIYKRAYRNHFSLWKSNTRNYKKCTDCIKPVEPSEKRQNFKVKN